MHESIEIVGWRRFQHYRTRTPPWIKLYTELLSDDAFLSLSGYLRGLLICLWMEYGRSHCEMDASPTRLSRRLAMTVTRAHLNSLSDAGFIRIGASKPLAKRYGREVLRTSKRGDNSGDLGKAAALSPQQQLAAAAKRYVDNWNGGTSDAFDEGLDELEHLTGARLQAGDRYRLWEQALDG